MDAVATPRLKSVGRWALLAVAMGGAVVLGYSGRHHVGLWAAAATVLLAAGVRVFWPRLQALAGPSYLPPTPAWVTRAVEVAPVAALAGALAYAGLTGEMPRLFLGTVGFFALVGLVWWASVIAEETHRAHVRAEAGLEPEICAQGLVVEPIGPGGRPGVVMIRDKRWRASAAERISTGRKVHVMRVIDGIAEVRQDEG